MVARELWSCIGGLFGYDPGMKNVEAKALNKRMAEAIGGAKSMPGYSAEKTIHELNDISKERAEEEIRQNESMLEDAAAKTNDTIAKLTIGACVKDNISGPGLATMKYLSDHSGKVSYVPESLVKAWDMNDFVAKPGQKTWGSERSDGNSALDRIKYMGMGLMTSGSPYSIPLIAASAPAGGSNEGSSNWWKYVLAALIVGGAMFGGYKMFIDTPENRFVRAAQAKGVSAGEAGDIYDHIYDAAMNDRQITVDRQKIVSGTAQRLLDTGVVAAHPAHWTLQALGNMTVAETQLSLPKVASAALTNATQLDPEYKGSIVDFTVLHVKNNDGVMADVGSASPARDTWMLAKLLTERPDLAPQAEKHAWLNQLVRQNAYNMFDGPYGLKGVDYKEMHSPAEAKVWDVLLGFNDYMDRLPAKLAANNIEMVYPYNDLSKLKGKIADYTNRTIALMYLADIPRSSWMLGANEPVKGIDGMVNYVHRLDGKLDAFLKSHNNPASQEKALGEGVGSLIADRHNNGLRNTVYQALDMEKPDMNDPASMHAAYDKMDKAGTDEGAVGVWKAVPRLAREAIGYVRGVACDDMSQNGEVSTYKFDFPMLFKALGIPASGFTASPYIDGTAGAEYAIPVTDAEVRFLKQKYGPKIAIGYGNMIDPFYSCVYGAELDGITKISQANGYCPMGDNLNGPLLWKK